MKARECWRVVPSVTGLWASSHGRLQVRGYSHRMRDGRVLVRDSKPIIGQWDGKRYIYRLRGTTYKVARLVCEAFKGKPKPDRNYCLHRDENSRNNTPGNLKWGTQKENLNAPGFLAYCRGRTGANSPTTKGRMKCSTDA